MQSRKKFYYKIKYAWHKLTHWEYWPQEVVYFPVYPLYIFYGLKLRSGFFVTANPHDGEMKTLIEPKKKIYDLIPKQYYPPTILINPGENFLQVLNKVQLAAISFPLITKPNIGHKGVGVKKIIQRRNCSCIICR